jgi:hypothetical protein
MKKDCRVIPLGKVVVTIMLITTFMYTQAPDTVWTKVYGGTDYDLSYDVQQTSDGGYIIGASTYSFGAGIEDVWLVKTDVNGDTLWTKTYGGGAYDAAGGAYVQQTPDGGYFIASNTSSYGAGSCDLWLIRTGANGDSLWTKTYGGAKHEGSYPTVQQTTDGAYIIATNTRSFSTAPHEFDLWLLKIDTNGDTLWTKVYGGPEDDFPRSVIQTTDGGYFITGYTRSFGAGGDDVWLLKTDTNGDTIWTKTYGGTANDWGFSVQQTYDGGYILAGFTHSFGAGDRDAWIIKTDENGDTLWTKTYGGSAADAVTSVQLTSDNGYIFVGSTRSFGAGEYDVWVIRTDVNGDTLWTRTYGDEEIDVGRCVRLTSDGGYIICGITADYTDIWLLKTAAEEVPGFIRGTVTDQYNGLALPDVVVDLYNASGDSLLTITTTDNTGFYEFLGYPTNGSVHYLSDGEEYLIWMIPPDGYGTHDSPSRDVTVSAEVDFTAYECGGSYARGMGYWKHQVHMLLKGRVHDYTEADLVDFLDTIHDGWDYFDDIFTLEDMKDVFTANSCMADRAAKHLLALKLNVVSGKLYEGALIDLGELSDAATVGEAVLDCESILFDINSTNEDYERAKDIAEMLNNMEGFAGGGPQSLDSGSLAVSFDLSQNYPNPFSSMTSIPYSLFKRSHITLRIYNATGQLVNTLVDQTLEPGRYTAIWDRKDSYGHRVASGVYFARLGSGNNSIAEKLLLIR